MIHHLLTLWRRPPWAISTVYACARGELARHSPISDTKKAPSK